MCAGVEMTGRRALHRAWHPQAAAELGGNTIDLQALQPHTSTGLVYSAGFRERARPDRDKEKVASVQPSPLRASGAGPVSSWRRAITGAEKLQRRQGSPARFCFAVASGFSRPLSLLLECHSAA